jgi:hypothetical protein
VIAAPFVILRSSDHFGKRQDVFVFVMNLSKRVIAPTRIAGKALTACASSPFGGIKTKPKYRFGRSILEIFFPEAGTLIARTYMKVVFFGFSHYLLRPSLCHKPIPCAHKAA